MATLRNLARLSKLAFTEEEDASFLLVPVGSTPPCEGSYRIVNFDWTEAERTGDIDSEYQLWELFRGVRWSLVPQLYYRFGTFSGWGELIYTAKHGCVLDDYEIDRWLAAFPYASATRKKES